MAIDFDSITEDNGNGSVLANGGYVFTIQSITLGGDGFFDLVWDIAEGPEEGRFKGEEDWKHSERVYFSGKSASRLKHQLNCIADSSGKTRDQVYAMANSIIDQDKNHNAASAAMQGLKFGAYLRKYRYVSKSGRDSFSPKTGCWYTADDIRSGNFKAEEDRYQKDYAEKKAAIATEPTPETVAAPDIDFSKAATSDIPF